MSLVPNLKDLANQIFARESNDIWNATTRERMKVIEDAGARNILRSGIYWSSRLRIEEDYLRRLCQARAQSYLTVLKEARILLEDEHVAEIMSEVSTLADRLVVDMGDQLGQEISREQSSVTEGWARGNLLRVAESAKATIRRNLIIERGFQELRRKAHQETKTTDEAFVVMSFSPGLNSLYEIAILPAIIESGLNPYRVDKEEFEGTITQAILEKIESCKLVIADVTHERPNCYYELGYAVALGKPYIITARADHDPRRPGRSKEDLKVHFDLDSHKITYWNTGAMAELKQELINRIRKILDGG